MNAPAVIEARADATVSAADLRDACALLRMAVAKRTTVPVLTMIKVAAHAEGLRLTATDLDVELTVSLPFEGVASAGAAMIPMHRIEAIQKAASVLGEASIGISWTATTILLSAGAAQSRCQQVCNVADFPKWSEDGFTPHASAQRGDLRRLLALSLPCVSTEETRYYLNGVALQAHDQNLRAIATDGHRMAVIDAPSIDWSAGNMILPTAAARLVMAILGSRLTRGDFAMIDIHDAPKLRLQVGAVTLVAKLIDGTFPNYTRVLPSRDDGWDAIDFTVSRAQVRTLAALAPQSRVGVSRAVTFDADSGFMWSSDAEEAARLPIAGKGFASFNLRYLGAVTAMEPVVRLRAKGSRDPAVVTGEDPDAFWVIMPMQIGSEEAKRVAEGWA